MKLASFHQDVRNFLFSQGVPIPFPGNIHVVIKGGTDTEDYWTQRVDSGFLHSTIADAFANVEDKQNDVVIITPESHSLSAGLTIDENMVHVVGSYMGSRMNIRNRIGMSTAFSPMITVSGYGNTFHNIYTMHGTAAADYIGWSISGARNSFYNVHFGGPMNASQGGHADYEGVALDGSECFFKDCVFGTDTIGRDEVSPNITLGAGTLTIFENCTFLCNLSDGDPVFVKVENSSGYTWAIFKSCTFMAFNSNYATAMTKAFHFTGGSSCAMVFTPDCVFQNVTNLSAADKDQYIWLPRTFSTTTDTEAMVSVQLTV